MGQSRYLVSDLFPKKLQRNLGSSLYTNMILKDLRQAKDLFHNKGVRCSDAGDIRIVVDSMNRLYRTESNIKHAHSLIRFTNKNTRRSEKDMPRSLRLGVPFFFRIVGDRKKRNNDVENLEDYTRIKQNILTKKKGFYSVPKIYRSRICSVSTSRYDETILALRNQLKGLKLAKKLIDDDTLQDSDFDLCLRPGKDEDKRIHKKHIWLNNRISRRKERLRSLASQNIDELHLKIGAYSWFRETSRIENFRKRF